MMNLRITSFAGFLLGVCMTGPFVASAQPVLTDDDWVSAGPASLLFKASPKVDYRVSFYPCTNGYFYIQGVKNAIGNLVTGSSVAKWDGREWLPLADGEQPAPQPNTFTIGEDRYEVASGGRVMRVGDPGVQIGENFDGPITMLVEFQGELYAGGHFTSVGGTPANHAARWDGNTWSALGTGIEDGYVNDMAVLGPYLYVAGPFTVVDGAEVRGIARWNGTSWSPLGTGLDRWVNDLAVVGNDLYVAGSFIMAGGLVANRIAKWDGESWSALGMGIDPGVGIINFHLYPEREVYSIVEGADRHLYVSGFFRTAGGQTAHNIAQWDGTSWSRVGENGAGINGQVNVLKTTDKELYAAGRFSEVKGVRANGVAKWDGMSWSALSLGQGEFVSDIVVDGPDVYAWGSFTNAGDVQAIGIAKWSGTSWSVVASGLTNEIRYDLIASHMVKVDSDLYVSGAFTRAGGLSATNIAKWDGTSWSSLDSSFRVDNEVPLVASGSTLYAGSVATADGLQRGVGKWDGANWTILGPSDGDVSAMTVVDTTLYVAGKFHSIGGVAATNFARWDGASWAPLGPGIGDARPTHRISAIANHGSDLYAAVQFWTGDVPAEEPPPSQLYKWDGNSWTEVGSTTDRAIYAMVTLGDELYVGGEFSVAGGKASGNLARVFLNGVPPFEKIGSSATAFFRGMSAGGYRVDRTTDFNTWENLATRYTGEAGGIDFTDESAPESRAFYRALPVEFSTNPNPIP